jgi:iron complex transport system substrate-binding protein
MRKHNIQIVLIAMLLVLSLCTCGGKNAPSTDSGNGDKVIVVTDQAGRKVEISGTPERIVSGYYISSSACIALGLADKLVGIEARASTRPIYALAAPSLLELPNVGTAREFNLEACIALHPDLVILPLRLRDAADTLSELGVPAILVNPESYAELLEMVALIGEAAGTAEIANRLLDYYELSTFDIERTVAVLPYDNRPSVYMCGVSSYLTTAPRGMYQSVMIELAGGMNAANIDGDSWVEISYEQLLAINPEVMVIPAEASYDVSAIMGDAQLQKLSAVVSGKVYKMPADFEAWDSPVPSCMLGARWLLHVLHENLYSMDSLRKEAADFYREFYGIGINTALIVK